MQFSEFEQLVLGDSELSPHLSYFKGTAKPSVEIAIGRRWPGKVNSRFGGKPAVGSHFAWPANDMGEYRFLGQVNFSEIDNGPDTLPKSGLLSLFYADDEAGEVFWGDEGYVVAFFWPSTDNLRFFDTPYPVAPKSRKIKFRSGVDIPRYKELRDDWPLDSDAFCALAELAHNDLPRDYLLGYPSYFTLAYDPTPGPDWVQLLTLDSHDQFGWNWHDTAKLMVFIEKDRLARKDFSYLKCDAG